jgi:hypothetical protein
MTNNTCDKCAHYTPDPHKKNEGSCSLMGDINQRSNPIDGCSGWDMESYSAGVFVGPKFGCIHWIRREHADN